MASSTNGSGCPVDRAGSRYGAIRKATPTAMVPRAPMTPSSHMLGWKRGTRARMSTTIVTYSSR